MPFLLIKRIVLVESAIYVIGFNNIGSLLESQNTTEIIETTEKYIKQRCRLFCGLCEFSVFSVFLNTIRLDNLY